MEISNVIPNDVLAAAIDANGVAVIVDIRVSDLRPIGQVFWFEYHCWEHPESNDATVWYKSHQQVTVLEIVSDPVAYTTATERGEQGCVIVYNVRFEDGLEWSVFEDELLDSADQFTRLDPPLPPNKETPMIRNTKIASPSLETEVNQALSILQEIDLLAPGYRPGDDSNVWEWIDLSDMERTFDQLKIAASALDSAKSRLVRNLFEKAKSESH